MTPDNGDSKSPRLEVRLRGLYDQDRTEELSKALIPVIKGEIETIDMTDVEQIERGGLPGFLPLIKRLSTTPHRALVGVIGMNEDVKRTFDKTGLAKYFQQERRSDKK